MGVMGGNKNFEGSEAISNKEYDRLCAIQSLEQLLITLDEQEFDAVAEWNRRSILANSRMRAIECAQDSLSGHCFEDVRIQLCGEFFDTERYLADGDKECLEKISEINKIRLFTEAKLKFFKNQGVK